MPPEEFLDGEPDAHDLEAIEARARKLKQEEQN